MVEEFYPGELHPREFPPSVTKVSTNLEVGNLYISNNLSNSLEVRTLSDGLGNLSFINAKYPTRPKNLASKGYVDACIAGVLINIAVDHATTGNVDLQTDVESGDPIDSDFILAEGELLLVKDQIDQTQNGIYTVNLQGPPTRIAAADLANGQIIYVQEGDQNEGKVFVSNGAYVTPNYGTDNITFGTVQIWPQAPFGGSSGTGGGSSLILGAGKLAGNPNNVSGPAVSISLSPNFVLSSNGTLSLGTSGVTAGTYNQVTVNNQGLVIAGTNLTFGTGTVTSIIAGNGLTGGTIVNTGTIALGTTGVTAGTYGNASYVPQVVIDNTGRITSATQVAISNSGGVFWNDEVGTNTLMQANNGYIADVGAVQCVFTLPVTANVGDIVAVAGLSQGGWLIKQNSGQVVHFGYHDTTTGTSGSLNSTFRYDYIELLCVKQNTQFLVKSAIGNINII
jgi:hypothetical protein